MNDLYRTIEADLKKIPVLADRFRYWYEEVEEKYYPYSEYAHRSTFDRQRKIAATFPNTPGVQFMIGVIHLTMPEEFYNKYFDGWESDKRTFEFYIRIGAQHHFEYSLKPTFEENLATEVEKHNLIEAPFDQIAFMQSAIQEHNELVHRTKDRSSATQEGSQSAVHSLAHSHMIKYLDELRSKALLGSRSSEQKTQGSTPSEYQTFEDLFVNQSSEHIAECIQVLREVEPAIINLGDELLAEKGAMVVYIEALRNRSLIHRASDKIYTRLLSERFNFTMNASLFRKVNSRAVKKYREEIDHLLSHLSQV